MLVGLETKFLLETATLLTVLPSIRTPNLLSSLTISININGLNGSSDISALARQVVAHCDLIKPARLLEVEQLLRYMKNRKGGGAGELASSSL